LRSTCGICYNGNNMKNFESLDQALSERSGPTIEEKKNLFSSALLEQIRANLKDKIDPAEIGPEQAEAQNAMVEMRLKHLQEAYPKEFSLYQTYYILKKAQVPDTATKADFPDNDSVIKFIDTL